MSHQIKTMYVVHHSHTDIGYTDLQERVVDAQTDYIHSVLKIMQQAKNKDFRWNCETYFCVEQFLKTASEEETSEFFKLVRENQIGISATYLNFNDLVDSEIYSDRIAEMVEIFKQNGIHIRTAMCADINGISMGQRDAFINNGIEFLYTNIHCHHGMYPLYQNQKAYWWQNEAGKKLLVWNGEHYNLGNALGIKPNRSANFMTANYFGKEQDFSKPLRILNENIDQYLSLCENNDYQYDFIISSVSGVFSDNAPPETEILQMINDFNKEYSETVHLQMVSLQELYANIKDKLADSPVYRGDLNDWWSNGVGSTPYAVKHYKDAQRRYHLCQRLDEKCYNKYPELTRIAQDNLFLYAEHTWGHSSTITCPYDTMVLNLDMRKNSYASKAHEAASRMLNGIAKQKGDILRYYSTKGKIKVCSTNSFVGKQAVEFYIESPFVQNAKITDSNGNILPCQVSSHPRGKRITFIDTFKPHEEKLYVYEELPPKANAINSRKAYIGSERIKDIVNTYDPITYLLPYEFENKWFKLTYKPHKGITSFINKTTEKEMLPENQPPFFTPMYERTAIAMQQSEFSNKEEQERRVLGRNIRGKHAELFEGQLEEVICHEQGEIFTLLELKYTLPGTIHCNVFIKLFEAMPKIDFKLELGKTISTDIESIFMPMSLNLEQKALYLEKGAEAFRPGVDQLPGTCMEYYMSDDGLAYTYKNGSVLILTKDTPLVYMGKMEHHPIKLCDNQEENNLRPVYSWIMNNTWETNFKMDLSGFCEYMYSLYLCEDKDTKNAMNTLHELQYEPYTFIIE